MATNVPPIVFTATGPQAPTEASILVGVQGDINQAFGGNLNYALNTPQGQLASSETSIIGEAYNEFLFLSSMFDPTYSYGRWQDGIARIYFLYRNPAEATVVTCTCSGAVGVVIPSGALAQDTAGNTYACVSGGVISGFGTVSLAFANLLPGPVPCPAGSLTTIYQTIAGWDSITNPSDGVIGTNAETRAAFEARRQDSVAGNSQGPISAIIGAVAKVKGILDYFGYNNNTSSPVTINGKTIAANAIYIAAVGGKDADVAQAIFTRKGPGAPMVGNTTVTVYDSNPLYTAPQPYTIKFQRPSNLEVLFALNLVSGNGIPSDAAAQIQAVVINAFAGLYPNTPRPRISSLILASVFSTLVQEQLPWSKNAVRSCGIGSANTAVVTATASFATNVMTVSAILTGGNNLAVGQTIIDAGGSLPAGTTIASLGTGTGGTGTYNLSATVGTIGSETVSAILPSGNSVQVQADQEPVTSAPFIAVTVS